LVFKGVPARVCTNCGEEYVDENIVAALLQSAAEAARSGSGSASIHRTVIVANLFLNSFLTF
jgi:hypothetical protein